MHGTPEPVQLAPFARRIHSGAGEDGIIAKIFALLGVRAGMFVEFGAWDGRHLSNTRHLVEQGWHGILIEADAAKFAALQRNVTAPGVQLVHATVELAGDASLDSILTRAGCPAIIDLMSIDIDSDDLAVWMATQRHRARCVVIEYNVTIPFDTPFINPPGRAWGNGALSIARFAAERGYALVAMTGMNLVFLDRADAAAANIAEIGLELANAPPVPRYFWGYDGTLITHSERDGPTAAEIMPVPWHQAVFVQPLPPWLRRWRLGGEWRRTERAVGIAAALMLRPLSAWRHWLRRAARRAR